MIKTFFKYIDFTFLTKFILLFFPLYYFHILFLGITDPNNYYSQFLDEKLNYIKWLTSSINYTASLITHFFGINAIVNQKVIYVLSGANVYLEFPCLGLEIMSFWIAFVIAHKISWQRKFYWSLSGIAAIWFLNCWRIALLLIALQNWPPGANQINHHDIFNSVSYVIICLFIYLFYRNITAPQTA